MSITVQIASSGIAFWSLEKKKKELTFLSYKDGDPMYKKMAIYPCRHKAYIHKGLHRFLHIAYRLRLGFNSFAHSFLIRGFNSGILLSIPIKAEHEVTVHGSSVVSNLTPV